MDLGDVATSRLASVCDNERVFFTEVVLISPSPPLGLSLMICDSNNRISTLQDKNKKRNFNIYENKVVKKMKEKEK